MAIGLRWCHALGARDALSTLHRRTRPACGAPARCGGGQQPGIQERRSIGARGNPLDAVFGVELVGGDGARS